MSNWRNILRRRSKPAPVKRTRLNRPQDRGPVTRLTIGPSEMIKHTLPLDTSNCWLVQYEGESYRDWDRCWSDQGIKALVSLFRAAYPDVKVTWLKETKQQ